MSIVSELLKPFSKLFAGVQRSQQKSRGRQFLEELDNVDPNNRTQLLTVLTEWHTEIGFAHFNPRRAELTPYNGTFPREYQLTEALRRAHQAIYSERGIALEDIKIRTDRENTLDYFLSTADNFSIDPAEAFENILAVMVEIEMLLTHIDADYRREHYVLQYQTMQRDGLTVLELLARLSDLAVRA